MVSARSAAPTAFLLEVGEPLAASWRHRGKLCVILRAKVRNEGARIQAVVCHGESLTFENRKISRVPMTIS